MIIKALGIDIAKNVFQLHGVNERGKAVLKKIGEYYSLMTEGRIYGSEFFKHSSLQNRRGPYTAYISTIPHVVVRMNCDANIVSLGFGRPQPNLHLNTDE